MKPDPDEEWARWVEWLGEGPAPSIWEDVVAMMAARQIWEGFRILYFAAPEEARRNATFHSWLVQNYVHRQALAIRRQTDTDRDVVSLGHLIDQVRRYPHVLSRERYIERTAGWQSAAEADGFFDELVGPGRDHIDPNTARADLAKLKTGTRTVVSFVDNEVAHYNMAKGQFSQGLTFGDITQGIDLIVDMSVKYRLLIMGSGMAKSVSMSPWIGIFDTAWIPSMDRMFEVTARIDAIDTKRMLGEPVDDAF